MCAGIATDHRQRPTATQYHLPRAQLDRIVLVDGPCTAVDYHQAVLAGLGYGVRQIVVIVDDTGGADGDPIGRKIGRFVDLLVTGHHIRVADDTVNHTSLHTAQPATGTRSERNANVQAGFGLRTTQSVVLN